MSTAPAVEPSVAASQVHLKWWGKLALALVSMMLLFGVMEVAARVYAHLASRERLIEIDDVTGWHLAPNTRRWYRNETQPYFIATNSQGLRDVEHTYEKPAGVYRIVVIGDSFVFGAGGVEPARRFGDILQASTRNTEIINMGVPAYGTDQEYLYLATEGLRYHPDLVLMVAFYNDFSESFSTINPSNGRPKGYFSLDRGQLVFHPPTFSLFYRLAQHSYVLGLADLGLSKISHAYDESRRQKHWLLDSRTRLATFKELFASSAEVSLQHGAAFVLVYLPFQGQYEPFIIQQVMDDLAATRGMKTLDLMNTVKLANRVRPAYFAHDIHLNEYGNEVVAKALTNYLVENGYVQPAVSQVAGAVH
jgi:hypothetical protein